MFYPDALGVDTPTPKLVRDAFYTQFFHVEISGGATPMATTPLGMGRQI